ncbi:DUF4352 domain-containing protein [Streptomyces sp. BH055]|uniref:DUF4352 domain-containing protein n=1 Tax=Streptomyces sp. BH055 TaxID=3401173 RepID=UPI003BB649C5
MHHRTTTGLLAAGLLLGTITACGTSGDPEPAVTVTKTVTQEPEEQAAPKKDGPLTIGDKAPVESAEGSTASIEVLTYTHTEKGPESPGDELGGDSWATADIRVCNTGSDDISVSQTPWSLSYKGGTSMESTGLSGGDMPKPEFPMDKVLGAEKCARGKVAFPVHAKTRPATIDYAIDGESPIEWAVPKA